MVIFKKISKINNSLSLYFNNHTKTKFLFSISLYTLCFFSVFIPTLLQTINKTGTILGGDGITQYYCMLTDFRRNLIDFFSDLSDGTFSFKMVNFKYLFGSDIFTTSTIPFLPFLPLYALVVFVPEKSIGLFFAAVITIITYLCGITFIYMCKYFKRNTVWSSFFAVTYVFCGNFFYSAVWNPHFLYMLFIFPILVIGIDKILHKKSGLTLSFGVFFLTICFFYFLLYVIPFIIVFAAIRLYFIKKDNYIKNFLKYFIRGTFYVLLGIIFASFSFLPYLYIYLNSIRTVNTDINILPMLIPSAEYITKMLYPACIDNDTGICPVVIPFIIFSAISPRCKKENKVYLLITMLLVSLPVIRYGLNGFQYDLCRWGFIPACLCSFIAASSTPELINLNKKEVIQIIIYVGLYISAVIMHAQIIWIVFFAGTSIISLLPQSEEHIIKIYDKIKNIYKKISLYSDKHKHKCNQKNLLNHNIYNYFRIILFSVACILLVSVTIMFPNIQLKYIIAIIIVITTFVLILYYNNKNIRFTYSIFLPVLFITNYYSYTNYIDTASTINNNELYSKLSEYHHTENSFDRFSSIDAEANFLNYNSASSDSQYKYNIKSHNLALQYNFASSEAFLSVIDSDYINFLSRCGMDKSTINCSGAIDNFFGKEVIYSLFGINKMYSSSDKSNMYGIYNEDTISSDKSKEYIFRNQYSLPIGVTYDTFMDASQFYSYNSAELPYAMMNSVYLENSNIHSNNNMTYSYKCDTDLDIEAKSKTVSDTTCYDNTITTNNNFKDGFFYLCFSDVDCKLNPSVVAQPFKIYIDDTKEFTFSIGNNNSDWEWAYNSNLYTLPLGYCTDSPEKIKFTSYFEYGNAELYFIPADVYTNGYNRICKETMDHINISDNTLTGKVSVSSEKILCINMLHNDGWSAYVDGCKSEIYKANGLFLGIKLSQGQHDIKLIYRTPWLYEGVVISLISLLTTFFIKKVIHKKIHKK